MQGATWAFASVEVVHLLGLALLGGAVLILGLRAVGVILPDQPLGVLARGLVALLSAGLVTLIASGVLLVADGPLRYYANAAFRLKMALLLAAILSGLHVYRALQRGSQPTRVAIVISALLWLGVGLAGRAIGLL